MLRSTAARRSSRQLSASFSTSTSIETAWDTAPSKSSSANFRVISLVAGFLAGSGQGLFACVAREHAKTDGHASIKLRELYAARCFRTNVIVMRGLAAQHASYAHQRIKASCSCQHLCGDGQFKRTRNADDFQLLLGRSGARKCVERAGEQAIGDKSIEVAHHDSETQPRCVQPAAFAEAHVWFSMSRH